jgi:hypothetical protein
MYSSENELEAGVFSSVVFANGLFYSLFVFEAFADCVFSISFNSCWLLKTNGILIVSQTNAAIIPKAETL